LIKFSSKSIYLKEGKLHFSNTLKLTILFESDYSIKYRVEWFIYIPSDSFANIRGLKYCCDLKYEKIYKERDALKKEKLYPQCIEQYLRMNFFLSLLKKYLFRS